MPMRKRGTRCWIAKGLVWDAGEQHWTSQKPPNIWQINAAYNCKSSATKMSKCRTKIAYQLYQNSVPWEWPQQQEWLHVKDEIQECHNMLLALARSQQCPILETTEWTKQLSSRVVCFSSEQLSTSFTTKITGSGKKISNSCKIIRQQGTQILPREKSTSSAATATPDPLDDPPGIRSGAAGFTGVP